MNTVYIFNGDNSNFPSGAFTDYTLAEDWIKKHSLSGTLTAYPLNKGVYEWAIEQEHFKPTREYQTSPKFIQSFSSAAMEHYHFENGQLAT